jgi:hypothetical protein
MTVGTTFQQHIWLGVADTNGHYPMPSGLHVAQKQILSHLEGMQNAQCEIHYRSFSCLVIVNKSYGWIFF